MQAPEFPIHVTDYASKWDAQHYNPRAYTPGVLRSRDHSLDQELPGPPGHEPGAAPYANHNAADTRLTRKFGRRLSPGARAREKPTRAHAATATAQESRTPKSVLATLEGAN